MQRQHPLIASQEPRPSDPDNISVNVSLRDFTCPITEELYYYPVMLTSCGHMFEDSALQEHIKAHDDCPLCRTKVADVILAPPFLREQLEKLFILNPELIDQRYFNLVYLFEALEEGNEHKIERIIEFLYQSPKYINEIAVGKEKGTSAVYCLAMYDIGIKLLHKHKKLRDLVTVESLNAMTEDGTNAVYWLSLSEAGIQLLLDDPEFCAKITEEGLNCVEKKGVNVGETPVSWLASSAAGIKLLQTNPALRAKISSTGLNSISRGDDRGLSAVFWLTESLEGVSLLASDPVLCDKVSKQAFNSILQSVDPIQGVSAVYSLASTIEGRQLLCSNARLRGLITVDTLNLPVPVKDGRSAAYYLTNTHDGIKLIEMDDDLKGKIRETTAKRRMVGQASSAQRPRFFRPEPEERPDPATSRQISESVSRQRPQQRRFLRVPPPGSRPTEVRSQNVAYPVQVPTYVRTSPPGLQPNNGPAHKDKRKDRCSIM